MSQLLDTDQWLISEDCPHLIECLPSLIRDPNNPEDVLKVDYSENHIGDDPYDAARMGLQWMLGASQKPLEQRLQERLEKELESGDLTSAMFRIAQIREEEQRRRRPIPYALKGSALRRHIAAWEWKRSRM